MSALSIRTTLGMITLFEHDGALVALEWGEGFEAQDHTPLLDEAADQVCAYLLGKRQCFDIALNAHGSVFQKRVWAAMSAIPYGETRTYADIARDIGSSPRAVGGACGRNPLPLIVPCHRVVGTRGLGGYTGGEAIQTKRALLRLEGALS